MSAGCAVQPDTADATIQQQSLVSLHCAEGRRVSFATDLSVSHVQLGRAAGSGSVACIMT